jgi:hypothetical protein
MAEVKKRRVAVPGHMMQSINLDTADKLGRRESLVLAPRAPVEITEAQYRSREFQKLLARGYVVDLTAADERRKEIEARQAGAKASVIPAP